MPSLLIHHVVFVASTAEVPESCPHPACRADFHAGSNLREWAAREVHFSGNLDGPTHRPGFEVLDEHFGGVVFRPIAYCCGACGRLLCEGAVRTYSAERHLDLRLADALQPSLRLSTRWPG